MRETVSIVFLLLTAALGMCAFLAGQSRKAIAPSVMLLTGSLIPPVMGNLFIIASENQLLAQVGFFIYFLGMNFVMYALLRFTLAYCRLKWPNRVLKSAVYLLLILDAVQLLCNPIFHHAFAIEATIVEGSVYYRVHPYLGQAVHRVLDYGIFFVVLVIFFVKMLRAPRIYFERYSIIFFTMVLTGVWETYYIFSRTPIDQSMIGFGAFGLMVFYFALYYQPVRLLNQMLADISSGMSEALFLTDAVDRCVWVNRVGVEMTGLEDNDFDQGIERLKQVFPGLELGEKEWTDKRRLDDGQQVKYYALERHGLEDRKGRAVGSLLSIRDETTQQEAQKRERYNATHDRLTDLYTKDYLYECVHDRLRSDPHTEYMIGYLDVSDFKMVNDVFGNDFGDFVLRNIADILRRKMPGGCIYGRLGGDTFGICAPTGAFSTEDAERLMTEFIVTNGSLEHRLVLHLGIYEVTEPGLDVSVMFDRAHMALATIKNEFKRHVAYYDDTMRERVLWDQRIATQLNDALAEGQIRPYLQALVDEHGNVVGAEALVRWIHPTEGFLSPAAFVPAFERNGMIADVDRHMWRCACRILAEWKACGREDLFISVNISPKDFYFMDVVAELKNAVGEFGVDPACLRVEITETVMMTDNENRIAILNELKAAGFLVEMDDFGSGYSSLNMLTDMPVDVIKIDMLFLRKTSSDDRSQTVLQNIMHLTRDLGIASLTEGVETEDQYQMLSEMGCKMFQGFYFAKPMPVDDFERQFLSCADRQSARED